MRIEKDQARTLAALGGLMLLFVVGLWGPYRMRMNRLQAQIDKAQQQSLSDTQLTRKMVGLAGDVVELQEITSGAQRYVPEQGELADLLRQISSDLAASASLSGDGRIFDQEIQTGAITNYANYSVIPMTLKFKGSYAAIDGFLRHIESMNRLVRIDRLEIQGRSADLDPGKTPVLEATIALSAFFSPAAAALNEQADPSGSGRS